MSIEQLPDDIARPTLLRSITVRPVLDADGQETGFYDIPAGGRRFRALELLVKLKRLAKTAPMPCVIRTDGVAEEGSLAENVQRAPLHPLDQFRAILAPRDRPLRAIAELTRPASGRVASDPCHLGGLRGPISVIKCSLACRRGHQTHR